VVTVVAGAEEAFLRGTLHRRVEEVAGPGAAVAAGALAFAALHVPLYGWGAAPLDLAVGCWLGWLRLVTGGWAAPALAHTVADLAAWWLR
jgi:membrane protease YdiL (CAAX protease family)